MVISEMPEHGRGWATPPIVTRDLGGGRYRLEGLDFSIGGWWVLRATITTGDAKDIVRFNVVLE